jgi:hypothetical protein
MNEISIPADLFRNFVRRDYLSAEAQKYVITEACFLAGHPAKVDRPLELKLEHQRGCVCGRNPYA